MDMLVAGGAIEGVSASGLFASGLLAVLDWLKRRMSAVLRAGRASVPVPGANASARMFAYVATCVAGAVVGAVGKMPTPPPPPGAGKSLRLGSYEEMLAWNSSKLTEGRKS
jgi:N-acyl-D-aspartate/D-glutamate deacylase